jgi:hypothetical protein
MSAPGVRAFLQAANENERDCLAEYTKFVEFLDRIDGLFRRLTGKWSGGRDPLSGMLFMNAHASFLAAVRVAFSAQSPPTHMVLRGALESALYGLIASRSEENREIWLNREKDQDRCRQLYTARNAIRLLKGDPGLFHLLGEGYGLAIDLGAHPNRSSVLDHITFGETEEHYAISLTHLHSVPSTHAARAIAACIEFGLAILFISPHAFPDEARAGEIHAEATQMRHEYDQFIQDEFHYDGPPLPPGAAL